MLYADVMMLSWIAELEDFRPMLAPSILLRPAGEMYFRDSFTPQWHPRSRVQRKRLQLWGDNQGPMATSRLWSAQSRYVERKSNDSTPLWLMWALLNRRRFGTHFRWKESRRAAEYASYL